MTVLEQKEENSAVERLVRMLVGLNMPEFAPGGVPVKVAAAVLGKGPAYVQEGIRAGWLPIGCMKPGEQRDNFYISPKLLWELTGFVYTGQTAEEISI